MQKEEEDGLNKMIDEEMGTANVKSAEAKSKNTEQLVEELDEIDQAHPATMRFLKKGSNMVDFGTAVGAEERTFEFGDEENPRQVRRVIVNFSDDETLPLCLPITVARQVKEFLSRGFNKFEIIRSGSGIKTQYTVLPQTTEIK